MQFPWPEQLFTALQSGVLHAAPDQETLHWQTSYPCTGAVTYVINIQQQDFNMKIIVFNHRQDEMKEHSHRCLVTWPAPKSLRVSDWL